jgi:hypothetical protein
MQTLVLSGVLGTRLTRVLGDRPTALARLLTDGRFSSISSLASRTSAHGTLAGCERFQRLMDALG